MENIKIPDLPYVANPSDNATVVAVNNGSVVRIPKGSDTPGPGPTPTEYSPVPWKTIKTIEIHPILIPANDDRLSITYDFSEFEFEAETLYVPKMVFTDEEIDLYDIGDIQNKLIFLGTNTAIIDLYEYFEKVNLVCNPNAENPAYILFRETFYSNEYGNTTITCPNDNEMPEAIMFVDPGVESDLFDISYIEIAPTLYKYDEVMEFMFDNIPDEFESTDVQEFQVSATFHKIYRGYNNTIINM